MMCLAEIHLKVIASGAEAQVWRLVEATSQMDGAKKLREHFDAQPGIKTISVIIHKPIT